MSEGPRSQGVGPARTPRRWLAPRPAATLTPERCRAGRPDRGRQPPAGSGGRWPLSRALATGWPPGAAAGAAWAAPRLIQSGVSARARIPACARPGAGEAGPADLRPVTERPPVNRPDPLPGRHGRRSATASPGGEAATAEQPCAVMQPHPTLPHSRGRLQVMFLMLGGSRVAAPTKVRRAASARQGPVFSDLKAGCPTTQGRKKARLALEVPQD